MFSNGVLEQIGNTPIVRLTASTGANIYAKAEYLNPGGSIKDRIALFMIDDALKRGLLDKDTIIAEPTSGNTGIGISLVGGLMGFKVIIVMPENMSQERRKIIRALGAELVLTPAEESIEGSIRRLMK